jgi:hypothetical protein
MQLEMKKLDVERIKQEGKRRKMELDAEENNILMRMMQFMMTGRAQPPSTPVVSSSRMSTMMGGGGEMSNVEGFMSSSPMMPFSDFNFPSDLNEDYSNSSSPCI